MTGRVRNLLKGGSRGTALIEFSILLPVLLTLFLGGFQLAQGSACKRRVTIVARSLSDLISQYDTITPSQVDTILAASAQIIAPFDIANANSRVSMVSVDAAGNVKVVWSRVRGSNIAALAKGANFISLPTAMKTINTYYIYGEVYYAYNPFPGSGYSRPLSFDQTLFMVPRKSVSVECTAC